MRILHLNAMDNGGGAAIAALRHCEAQRSQGIEAELLCIRPRSGQPWVHDVKFDKKTSMVEQFVFNGVNRLMAKSSRPYASWSQSHMGFSLAKHPLVMRADAIWLHWVNHGMLSIRGIEQILKLGKPVVWYLHDMWPLTGGCHHSLGCDGFTCQCGRCPLLNERQGSHCDNDISRRQLRSKLRRLSGYANLTIVAPSQWLADLAAQSALFGHGRNQVKVLPNPLNTDTFSPVDKTEARRILGLNPDGRYILFGAAESRDAYKGWPLLRDALPALAAQGIECIVFGNKPDDTFADVDPAVRIHPLGRITDDVTKRIVYSAADLFVTPSQADNYPNVLVEAMACATPCVGFPIGGIPEIIRHGSSGIIASTVTPDALAEAVFEALNAHMGPAARTQVGQINSYQNYHLP